MKVAIIGAGFVGENLAHALIKVGHEVVLSSRTPDSEKIQTLIADLGEAARAGTVQATFAFSDVIAIALSWEAARGVAMGAGDWSGKILLDMTQGDSKELAELTGARVVKIFNTIGAEHYQNPDFNGQVASMLYCGDDAEAKRIAGQLATDIGFDAIDVGDLSMSVHLVNLARLWITLMRQSMGRDFAFKLIKK
ncbi:MAG TPA: NAD(P)-binding domain-containing protein [Aggregatilineales bacterium]|nr:NAD(P)-binding domain-containing protein [Aggregatilineales bacterium]